MKGVILAGGTGSRLGSLTHVTNKHLLPVGKYPMIIHSIFKLVEAGIEDIMIITGTEHMGDMINLLGSGQSYNCDLTYKVQTEPSGIAGALSLARNFVGNDSSVVILGDNIFEDSLYQIIHAYKSSKSFRENGPTCVLALKEVKDPQRFGVATLVANKIVGIEEKPDRPKSNMCITGIYVYDDHVFSMIDDLKKSDRGEYEITDVNNAYIACSGASWVELEGWWSDAGTPDSYHNANMLVRNGATNEM